MRNLKQYPITEDEVILAVENALKHYTNLKLIGGNDGFILHQLKNLLEQDADVMAKLVAALKV